jgi:hypothetical protein
MSTTADLRADPRPSSPPPASRRYWPLMLVMLAVTALALLTVAWSAIDALGSMPVHITVDGEELVQGLDLASMPPAHRIVLAAVIVFALLAALVVLPVALLMALAGVVLAAFAVVGLPLLAAAAVVAVVLSPLWLLGWLLWRALRPSPTMPG